ncbi:MAG: restriction endonuclease subunit S [Ardenticatenaceae bacterium]|nr:restriction endonuclease subunit S [Ardenticatenaceae bacterium]MCB8950072.1 restriction endonuclease subunit S [Ardenticatenaceae bacterium]
MTEGNLQKDWKELKLTELVSKEKYSIRRGPFGGAIKKEIFVPDGYKIYEQKNAIYDDMTLGNYFIDEKKYQELEGFAVQPGDFIISCSGTIGKIAIIPSDAKPGIINQALLKITPNPKVIDSKFFKWLLESPQIQRQMFGFASGSSIKNVKPLNEIRQTKFLVPELGEQRRIAAVLDKADALRQKRRAALARLDTLLQATFLHMFGDQDVEMVPISEAMAAIIDYRGKTPPKTESGIPLVTAKVVKDGFIEEPNEFIAEDFYDEWMRRGLPKVGDVVFTTEAPLGKVAQLKSSRIALAQRIVLLRGNPDFLDNKYLMHALSTPIVRQQIEQRATGSTVRGIRQKELRKVEVPIPQLEKQKEFNAVASKIEYLQSSHKDALLHLDNLFHALQQRAFSGQL